MIYLLDITDIDKICDFVGQNFKFLCELIGVNVKHRKGQSKL